MTIDLGTVLVSQQVAQRERHSATPHAPVVPHRPKARPTLRRTRTVTAAALVRVASRVAPA